MHNPPSEPLLEARKLAGLEPSLTQRVLLEAASGQPQQLPGAVEGLVEAVVWAGVAFRGVVSAKCADDIRETKS